MNTTILVDVRDDIRNGREPFSKIMNAASNLRAGENLLLIAPFEPVPLVHILNKQGFQHSASTNQAGDWEVLFFRRTDPHSPDGSPDGNKELTMPATPRTSQTLDVDVRGLEPPLPMVKILETLANIPPRAELRARTDRRPIHLYAQLKERGFCAQTEEQTDGSYLTYIRPS